MTSKTMSYRCMITIFIFPSMFMFLVAQGCFSSSTHSTSHPNFDDDDNGKYAEVWKGNVDFSDFWCGIPESSHRSHGRDDDRQRRRRRTLDDIIIDKFTLDHSFVFYRGECFEFGPGNELFYVRGGVGRKAEGCPIRWTRVGRSTCTLDEVEAMSGQRQAQRPYRFLWNNCHHFTEWLLRRLVSNECSVASGDTLVTPWSGLRHHGAGANGEQDSMTLLQQNGDYQEEKEDENDSNKGKQIERMEQRNERGEEAGEPEGIDYWYYYKKIFGSR